MSHEAQRHIQHREKETLTYTHMKGRWLRVKAGHTHLVSCLLFPVLYQAKGDMENTLDVDNRPARGRGYRQVTHL